MAVQFDQAQLATEIAGPVNTSFTSTANISVASNSNRFLFVSIFIGSTANPITGITWDQSGQNFTSLGAVNGNGGRLEFWGLVNPSVGSSKTITVNLTNSTNIGATFRVTSWFNVDQTISDITSTFTSNSNPASNSPTITQTSTTNDAIIGHFCSTGSGLTSLSNTTLISDTINGTDGSNYAVPSTSPSTTLSAITTGGGAGYTYAAITIKAAVSALPATLQSQICM